MQIINKIINKFKPKIYNLKQTIQKDQLLTKKIYKMSKTKSIINQQNYKNILQDSQSAQIKQQFDFKPPSSLNNRIYEDLQKKFTSAFFKDHQQQEYIIHRAFNCHNFTYLRNLPDNFKHGQILNKRKQKVTSQNQKQTISRNKDFQQKYHQRQSKIKQKKKQQIGTLGYFTAFDYQQSNYQMPKILDAIQRIQSEKKRKQISNLDFRPSGIQSKLKYEDPFRYIQKAKGQSQQQSLSENYLFPFHLPQDTYDVYHESQKRRKIISDSLKIDGDFIPSKKQRTLSRVNKQQLGQMVNQIEIFLKKYLKEIGFFIGVTKSDHIEILFEQKYKNENKVNIMMSKICQHQLISKFILRRNLNKWGKIDKQKGYIVYCMLPSWVKNPTEQLNKN